MEGLDKLLRQLDDISDMEDELFGIMNECGKFIADDARLRVAVDKGDLRKSIQHTTRKVEGGIETCAHTNSDHAAFVEFGTGPAGREHHEGISLNVAPVYRQEKWRARIPSLVSDTDSGIRYIAGQQAQPYLYPALKDNEEQLSDYVKSGIANAVRRKIHG